MIIDAKAHDEHRLRAFVQKVGGYTFAWMIALEICEGESSCLGRSKFETGQSGGVEAENGS